MKDRSKPYLLFVDFRRAFGLSSRDATTTVWPDAVAEPVEPSTQIVRILRRVQQAPITNEGSAALANRIMGASLRWIAPGGDLRFHLSRVNIRRAHGMIREHYADIIHRWMQPDGR